MASDTRRLRVVVTGDSGDAQQAIEAVGEASTDTNSRLGTLAGTFARWAARGAIALGAVGAAAGAMGIKTAMQLEQVEVGFTTMLGSGEKAKSFMEDLAKFAAATPFEFPELVGSAQRFLAMGFAAEEIIPMLTAVGDAVAAMGGSAESVDAVTRALGQMQAKGKVSSEELLQLTEQGIPALQILADSFGVSTAEMSKLVEKGQIMADKAIPALIKGLKDGTKNVQGFGGMMEKQSATMAGKWSTFIDTVQTGLGRLVRNGEPQIKSFLDFAGKAFSDFFAGLEGKGQLQGFHGTINEIGLGLRALVSAFREGDVTSDGLVGKFEQVGVALRGIVEAVKETIAVTMRIVHWFQEHETTSKVLIGTIATLTALVKAHALAMWLSSGAMKKWLLNSTLVVTTTKVWAAAQWALNSAIAVGGWIQFIAFAAKYHAITKVMPALTKAWAAAQAALNFVMNLNPIGLIIIAVVALIAAIVLLWKNSETFRKIVTAAWEGIKKAALAVADWFMTSALPVIKAVWEGIATGALWLWHHVIEPVWKGIKVAVSIVVAYFQNVVMPIYSRVFRVLGVLVQIWANLFKAAWILIQVAVKIAILYIQNVLWPIYKTVFNLMAGVVMFLWKNVTEPAFKGMQIIIGALVNFFLSFIWPKWKFVFDLIIGIIKFLVSVFKERFNVAKTLALALLEWFASVFVARFRKAFDLLKGFLSLLSGEFKTKFNLIKSAVDLVLTGIVKGFNIAKDGIRKAWNQIQDIAKKPVNFVISPVYSTLRKLFNGVAEKFGIKTRLDEIKQFARGGVLPGYEPGRDKHPAILSAGEGIAVPQLVKQIGKSRFMKWNRDAWMGKSVAFEGFARGGIAGDGPGDLLKKIGGGLGGIVRGLGWKVVEPLVKGIRGLIDKVPGQGSFKDIVKAVPGKALDGFVSWFKKNDTFAMGDGRVLGYQNQMRLLRAVFPGLPLYSGFRPNAITASGNRSWHALGRAVDIPPRMDVFNWIANNFGRNTKELIWLGAANRNIQNGQIHRYSDALLQQHGVAGMPNAHIHWAMDGETTVQPGWFLGNNRTGRPETLVNKDRVATVTVENMNVYVAGDITQAQAEKVADKIYAELLKKANRNGGKIVLPTKSR